MLVRMNPTDNRVPAKDAVGLPLGCREAIERIGQRFHDAQERRASRCAPRLALAPKGGARPASPTGRRVSSQGPGPAPAPKGGARPVSPKGAPKAKAAAALTTPAVGCGITAARVLGPPKDAASAVLAPFPRPSTLVTRSPPGTPPKEAASAVGASTVSVAKRTSSTPATRRLTSGTSSGNNSTLIAAASVSLGKSRASGLRASTSQPACKTDGACCEPS